MIARLRTLALPAAACAALLSACGSDSPAAAKGAVAAPEIPSEVVRIWPGPPPGTESWTGDEAELDADLPGAGRVRIVTNVTSPTVTVFRPAAARSRGAAMIVLPGGAFRALAWDLEGSEVARWLAGRGITAFVLKYRVRPPGASAPAGAESFDRFFARTEAARALAVADARQALRWVRKNAARYRVRSDRLGMIGFSAGAMTALGAALDPDKTVRPDFAVAAYGAMAAGAAPPSDGPPLFMVAAQDDPQVPPGKSLEIDQAWRRAGLPAELHLYERGGHGFGMRPRGLPVDGWTGALDRWLQSRGLAVAPEPGRD